MWIVNSEFIDWTVVCVCSVHACIVCKLWTKQRGRIQAANGFYSHYCIYGSGIWRRRCWITHTHFFVVSFLFCFSFSFAFQMYISFFVDHFLSARFCFIFFWFCFTIYCCCCCCWFYVLVLAFVTILKCRSIQRTAHDCVSIVLPLLQLRWFRSHVRRQWVSVCVCNVLNVQQRFHLSDGMIDASPNGCLHQAFYSNNVLAKNEKKFRPIALKFRAHGAIA